MRTAMFVVSLCVAAGCVSGEATNTEESQVLGASCTVRRPNSWGTAGHLCVERRAPAITLLDGELYETISVPGGPIFTGEGTLTLLCNNGAIEVVDSTCN